MRVLDLLTRFDDALDWQVDDPLLADHLPSEHCDEPWPPVGASCAG